MTTSMSEFHLSQNLPLLGALLASLYFLSHIAQALYNVYFHPLSKYPGPWLAGATSLPTSYHRLMGGEPLWLRELHDKYGPVVRYLPGQLSYIDGRAWKDIFGHKVNGRGDMPKDIRIEVPSLGGRHSLILMNDADHARARRLLAHAMSDKALREQQSIIAGYVRDLVAKVRHIAAMKDGGEIDILRWYNFTTFDIVADLSFGEPMGMLAQGEWTPWVHAINKMIPIHSRLAVFTRFFPLLGWLLKHILPASTFEPLKLHISYSKAQVDKRLARETQRPDFWKYILRNQGKENGTLSTEENHAMGMTLMIAGSETTATLLSGLTWHLLRNPDKYQRLVDEVRTAFSSLDEIHMDSLTHLPYLFACLEEGLRMYPPVPNSQTRGVPAGGRMVIDDYVPEGTVVGVSHWAAYNSSANWYKADEFLPERWLAENQDKGPFAKDRRDVFQPFSFGPRNCVGKNLAYHEMRLILSNMLWNFDLSLSDQSKDWGIGQKVYGMAVKPPLFIKPRFAIRENAQGAL